MVQSLLHVLTVALFATISLGAFAVVIREILGSRRHISAALLGEGRYVAVRPWPSRARTVSRPHSSPPRLAPQHRATA